MFTMFELVYFVVGMAINLFEFEFDQGICTNIHSSYGVNVQILHLNSLRPSDAYMRR